MNKRTWSVVKNKHSTDYNKNQIKLQLVFQGEERKDDRSFWKYKGEDAECNELVDTNDLWENIGKLEWTIWFNYIGGINQS